MLLLSHVPNAFIKKFRLMGRIVLVGPHNIGYWTAVVRNEWQVGNSGLLQKSPLLQSLKFNIETSNRLKPLRVSLDAA
jgi:hypothetical protein